MPNEGISSDMFQYLSNHFSQGQSKDLNMGKNIQTLDRGLLIHDFL